MIELNTPDHLLPPELRQQIEKANAPYVNNLHKRLNTPVPGNPHGGFPGLGLVADHKQTLLVIRTELIDKWNTENPDHEFVVSEPLEKPITREEIEIKLRENSARPAVRAKVDQAHIDHIEEVLQDLPEEHHEGLRAFLEHETNTYGKKPQQYYWRRATTVQAIKDKGLDPSNVMHRYQHHLETGPESLEGPPKEEEQVDAQS